MRGKDPQNTTFGSPGKRNVTPFFLGLGRRLLFQFKVRILCQSGGPLLLKLPLLLILIALRVKNWKSSNLIAQHLLLPKEPERVERRWRGSTFLGA